MNILNNKWLQGFFALFPIIFIVLFVLLYFIFILSIVNSAGSDPLRKESPEKIFSYMSGIFLVFFFMMVIILLSLIYYIIHMVKNPNLKTEENRNMVIVWVLLTIIIYPIGQFIYWLVEIVGKKPRPIIS